jgi:hypothetical protein
MNYRRDKTAESSVLAEQRKPSVQRWGETSSRCACRDVEHQRRSTFEITLTPALSRITGRG